MRNLLGPPNRSDLIAGLAAVGVLVICYALGLPFWLGLLAGVLIYAGARLLGSGDGATKPARPMANEAIIRELLEISERIPKTPATFGDVQRLFRLIAQDAEQILRDLTAEGDPLGLEALVHQSILTILDNARKFERFSRRAGAGDHPSVKTLVEFLAQIRATLQRARQKLVDNDAEALEQEISMSKHFLEESAQIYLGDGRTG